MGQLCGTGDSTKEELYIGVERRWAFIGRQMSRWRVKLLSKDFVHEFERTAMSPCHDLM